MKHIQKICCLFWGALALFLYPSLSPIIPAQETVSLQKNLPGDLLPEPPEGMTWKLVWNDEFDGTEIDYVNKWEAVNGPRRDGFWSKEAFALDGNGCLRMKTFQNDEGQFVDGCLRSRGKYEKVKGFFVARMKTQKEVGHWSAFWLYNDSEGNRGEGSKNGAEIDIMEKPWLDARINHAIHWDGYGPEHKSVVSVSEEEESADGFHTYSLWWGDDAYRFYIDGRQTWETTADGICEKPLYLKISDEIGNWAGDIKTAKLPDETLIDYVRVYDLVPIVPESNADDDAADAEGDDGRENVPEAEEHLVDVNQELPRYIEVPYTAAEEKIEWIPIFEGISAARLESTDPRLRISLLKIDTKAKGVSLVTTGRYPEYTENENETNRETTVDFLQRNDLAVAINANFYTPFDGFTLKNPGPSNECGLVVSDGVVVSPVQDGFPTFLMTKEGTPEIRVVAADENTDNIYLAVSGNEIILKDGEIVANDLSTHPRTGIGISENLRYLYFITIDGRQLNWSVGATTVLVAEYLKKAGAYQGLNLDGGGSTTMVRATGDGPELLNLPVGLGRPGSLRHNGNSIGARANPL